MHMFNSTLYKERADFKLCSLFLAFHGLSEKVLPKIFIKKVFIGIKFGMRSCIIFNIYIRSKPINVGSILVLKPFTRY